MGGGNIVAVLFDGERGRKEQILMKVFSQITITFPL
jgi:hypothetical protein